MMFPHKEEVRCNLCGRKIIRTRKAPPRPSETKKRKPTCSDCRFKEAGKKWMGFGRMRSRKPD